VEVEVQLHIAQHHVDLGVGVVDGGHHLEVGVERQPAVGRGSSGRRTPRSGSPWSHAAGGTERKSLARRRRCRPPAARRGCNTG
jgi:hypothetical protein